MSNESVVLISWVSLVCCVTLIVLIIGSHILAVLSDRFYPIFYQYYYSRPARFLGSFLLMIAFAMIFIAVDGYVRR